MSAADDGWGQPVHGRCPACGGGSLFVAVGQHVTCSASGCPNPTLVADLLDGGFTRTLDAYERLWLRHGWAVSRLRSIVDGLDLHEGLPSPHELRTGEPREDELRFYAEVRARQEAEQ